ncbi:hypothetical protein ACOSQ2_003293 [Xanthoceras sorbifolium]
MASSVASSNSKVVSSWWKFLRGLQIPSKVASSNFKINFDAALNFHGHKMGFGVVICNFDGLVLVSCSHMAIGLFSPDVGETLAILRGIQIVTDMGFSSVCVEFDAATIMKQLSSKVISCSDVGLIVEDILALVSCFSNFSISFVRWSANKVAHGLAKLTLSHHSDDVWVENVPSCGASLVSNDIRVIL